MGKPAACVGADTHMCPASTGDTAHVGGPINGPGSSTVLIGGMPAAIQGDMCVCNGPPAAIAAGSGGVFFDGVPASRLGDPTSHGGAIASGNGAVLIGESGGGGASGSGEAAEGEVLEQLADDFLEIELTDEAGKIVPFAAYQVTLPDGSIVDGFLNGNGYAYVKLLEPGDAEVSFPEANQNEWDE